MDAHRISLLGAGFIGRFYAATLHRGRGRDRVHTLYSRSEDGARTLAETFGLRRWTTDMTDAVEDPDTDIVVVGLPNDLHAAAVAAAAAAGKAVLCTKPLGRSAAEARRMLDAVANPHDADVPMYWWSNTAVPEREDVRVIVSADSAYNFGYGEGGPARVDMPVVQGTDVSYVTNVERAADFFFHVPTEDGQRPWMTALDRDGWGLVQTSTDRLKGRKLFLWGMWGMGAGGRRWQEWSRNPATATSRSRRAWRARRWSTCRCRPAPPGTGWRPTA